MHMSYGCKGPLISVSQEVEFCWFDYYLRLYPLNGFVQFLNDFRSPFVDKAADPAATGWHSTVGKDSPKIYAVVLCCNSLSIAGTLFLLRLSYKTNRH